MEVLARVPLHNGWWLDREPYLAHMRAQRQPQPSLLAPNSNPTQQEPHPSTGLPVPPSLVKPANNEAVGPLVQGHPLCPSVSQPRVSPECTSAHPATSGYVSPNAWDPGDSKEWLGGGALLGAHMTTQRRSDTCELRVLHHRAAELSSSTPQATASLCEQM